MPKIVDSLPPATASKPSKPLNTNTRAGRRKLAVATAAPSPDLPTIEQLQRELAETKETLGESDKALIAERERARAAEKLAANRGFAIDHLNSEVAAANAATAVGDTSGEIAKLKEQLAAAEARATEAAKDAADAEQRAEEAEEVKTSAESEADEAASAAMTVARTDFEVAVDYLKRFAAGKTTAAWCDVCNTAGDRHTPECLIGIVLAVRADAASNVATWPALAEELRAAVMPLLETLPKWRGIDWEAAHLTAVDLVMLQTMGRRVWDVATKLDEARNG